MPILTPKAGIAMLEKMALVEYGIHCQITGEPGPFTVSPTQRRNMALVLGDLAATYQTLAARIDPPGDLAWQAKPGEEPTAEEPAPKRFELPEGAFEAAMERAESQLATTP